MQKLNYHRALANGFLKREFWALATSNTQRSGIGKKPYQFRTLADGSYELISANKPYKTS